MIRETPRWTYKSSAPLTQWYGHVHLLPERALGQWFCVDRASGALLWRRTHFRPNTIVGIGSDVIVASEMRSDGPWTADFGCYGISLETGRRLWTSHGSGFWKFALRALDFVPGYTNEFRDEPRLVRDGKVYCRSGRVLDTRSGATIDRIAREEIAAIQLPQSDAERLYAGEKVRVAKGLSVVRPGGATWHDGGWQIAAENDAGETVWHVSAKTLTRTIASAFYGYRLAERYVYVLLSEEPSTVPHPTKLHYAVANPTRWHLVAIDVATGEVVQDVRLDEEKRPECRIEDVDVTGVLISVGRELKYFERTG
jgi:hypothetical protein